MRGVKTKHYSPNGKVSLSIKELDPPKDPGAERAVIATLYVEPERALPIAQNLNLKSEHFFYNEHKELLNFLHLFIEDHPIEELGEVSFRNFLERRKKEHLYDYLLSILEEAVPMTLFKTAIGIVKEKAILRKTIEREIEILFSVKEEADLYKLRELHEKALEEIKETKIEKIEPEEWLYEIALEYSEEEAKVEWLVPDMVPKRSMVLFTSQAGVGKTYLMYALMKTYLLPKGEKIIYLDMDNSRVVINKRLKQSGLGQYTKPSKDPKLFIISRDEKRIFVGSEAWDKFKEAMRILSERGEHRVIIVDSLKNISRNMDLNSDKETEYVMSELKDLMSMGHTVIVVHHVPKILNPDLPFKNSGTILDNVEMAFHLKRDKEKNIVTLKCFKTRFDVEPTFYYTIDGEMNMEPAYPPEVLEEIEIVKTILEVIGLGGKGKREIEEETAKKTDKIGKHKVGEYLDKYNGKIWTSREERTNGRPKTAYYPLQNIDIAQVVVPQFLPSGQKSEEPSSPCATAFAQNPSPYIYKEKLGKSPKEETIKEMAEEIISWGGEIDLEIAKYTDPDELVEDIKDDPNLQAILLEQWIAMAGGNVESFKGMIESVRSGKAGIDWAHKTAKAEMEGDDDVEVDF